MCHCVVEQLGLLVTPASSGRGYAAAGSSLAGYRGKRQTNSFRWCDGGRRRGRVCASQAVQAVSPRSNRRCCQEAAVGCSWPTRPQIHRSNQQPQPQQLRRYRAYAVAAVRDLHCNRVRGERTLSQLRTGGAAPSFIYSWKGCLTYLCLLQPRRRYSAASQSALRCSIVVIDLSTKGTMWSLPYPSAWANLRYDPLSSDRMTKSGMMRPVHSFRSSSHCLTMLAGEQCVCRVDSREIVNCVSELRTTVASPYVTVHGKHCLVFDILNAHSNRT